MELHSCQIIGTKRFPRYKNQHTPNHKTQLKIPNGMRYKTISQYANKIMG